MRICYEHYISQPTPQEQKCSSHWMAISGQLKSSFCAGICTDGDAAMTGRLSGLIARNKEVAPESESTHCIIHRERLASRKMLQEFTSVLDDVAKFINHIKKRALTTCQFKQLCEEMDAEPRRLLLYAV